MHDLDEILQSDDAPQERDRLGVPALVLAPAVLRIVIAGKDIDTELDALVTAVATLQGSDGVMRNLVYDMAVDLAQAVEDSGIVGLAEATKSGLGPDETAMAFQIALAAVFSSPRGEDGDIGVLSAIAERLSFSETNFAKAYESARRAIADR